MLNKENLLKLAKVVARADKSAPTAYSYEGANYNYAELNETLRRELNEYAGSYQLYRENKNLIFDLIEQTIDEILPEKMSIAYDKFAEVKQFAQGDKPIFKRKLTANSKLRAKQFITRAGLAGRYEVFRLANPQEETFEVKTSALGGAAQIGLEEFLDGRVDFAELTQVVMDGINELIFEEIGKALAESVAQLPTVNKVSCTGFDEAAFDELLIKAEAYGTPQIYCTYEFAVKMIPQEAWRYTESMKDELNRTGRLAMYKGHNVIIIPQGFKDETLQEKVIDPGYCWIIPSGANFKPVKVALEGDTLMREVENHDWSRDIQVYKKVGVACIMDNNILCYVDSSLKGKMEKWSLEDTVENVVATKTYTGKPNSTVNSNSEDQDAASGN